MSDLIPLCISAFIVGIFHALEPGHCKAAMVGALLTSKHPYLDPIRLGLASAFGHMLGIVCFAYLSFIFAHEILEEGVLPKVENIIGIVIISIGLYMFYLITKKRHDSKCSCYCQHHHHEHSNDYFLPGVGFLIGLVPCPTVLALSLSAVNVKTHLGVAALSASFGIGVAISLIVLGVIVVQSSKALAELPIFQRVSKFSAYIPPIIFILIGIVMLSHFTSEHIHHVH